MNLYNKKSLLLRDSNMELLRVVAMSLVVLSHFNGFGLGYFGMKSYSPSVYNVCSLSICESFLVIGVPIFILISGYYGIKLRVKAVLNLCLICLFYQILLLILNVSFFSEPLTVKGIVKLFFPISTSGSGWWFIPVYFCLMLCSPILNKAVEAFSNKENIEVLVLLLLVNCYFGYIRRLGSISGGMGTNLINFVFIYYIGRVIRVFENKIQYHFWQPFLAYLLLSIVNGCILIFLYYKTNMNHSIMIEYNNPLLILAAVSFFLFFKKLSFKSAFVNWMGKSSLAIYLLHIREPISSLLFPFNTNCINSVGYSGIIMYLKLILLFFAIIYISILIDQIRILIMNPLLAFIDKKTSMIINKAEFYFNLL